MAYNINPIKSNKTTFNNNKQQKLYRHYYPPSSPQKLICHTSKFSTSTFSPSNKYTLASNESTWIPYGDS